MKKILIQILKIAGFLALGILLLYFAFRGVAFNELASTLQKVNFWWIALSLLFAGISFLSRARRWMLLIEPLGFKPSFKNTYHSLMVGYLSNYALPRLGEVTRCVTLGNREKIPVDSLIGTVIIERVTDMLMLMLILLILLISWMEKFGAFFSEQVLQPMQQKLVEVFGGTAVFWMIVGAALVLLFLLIYLLRKRLYRFSLVRKIKDIITGVLDGLKTIYRMKRKWEFVFHSVLIWVFYILMTWVVVFALEELSGLTFIDGMFLLVIGGLGMSAPVTAGFGAYHWITSRGLMFVYD
ncbi:MAG: lysylphosphatidylglycerol synthase transmembrane domain-containing protein, partial [Bacteroidota bacterium]|nr:lysylphosphatidylglycerol synthase transmembrane domain-containing protein [Bacteroidota bacterium]